MHLRIGAARRRAGTILLIVASLSVSLLMLELGIRAYSALFFPRMMIIDRKLGWKHAANRKKTFVNEYHEKVLVVHNANGHRGSYYDVAKGKGKGKYRILILGDSFTEGCTVSEEQLFSSRLEAANPGLEVLNAGVGGYGTVQEYLYLESEGIKFNPDLVLLMFYENDLSDNCWSFYPGFGPRPHATFEEGRVQIVEKPDPTRFAKYALPVPFLESVNRHSYLYGFLNTRIYQRLFADRMKRNLKEDWKMAEDSLPYEVFFGTIEKMLQTLETRRVGFCLVLIPTRKEVRDGQADRLDPIVRFCRDRGIHCIQLLDRLRKESRMGKTPYFAVDSHWTKAGHEIVTDEIGRYVNTLVDGPAPRAAPSASPSR